MILNGELVDSNSHDDFGALYAAMSDDEILELAGQGGLRPDAEAILAEQLRVRNISSSAVDAERHRQNRAALQARVGRNPYSKRKGFGLQFRGKTFLSEEDERHGIQIKTRWFVMLWMSVVPLGSYRVKPVANGAKGYQLISKSYLIISKEPLNWEQVRSGWMVTASILLVVVCAPYWLRWFSR